MQLLIARYVGCPNASHSTRATVHAPQSPSSQPHLLPVRPEARNQRRRVVVAATSSMCTSSPLSRKSKQLVLFSIGVAREEMPVMLNRCQQNPRPANESWVA